MIKSIKPFRQTRVNLEANPNLQGNCLVEKNVEIITSFMNDRKVLDYITEFNHFDFYIDLFRKYFKVYTPATHKEQILSEVQRVLHQFMYSILDYKQINTRSIRNAKDIVFTHWKFTLKNLNYLLENPTFIFFNSL